MTEERSQRQEFFLLRWIDRVAEISGYLSGLCIFLATLIICYAVVLRAMGHSTVWQTELATYLLIFVTFVGGAYGLKHGSHVNVDLLVNRLPPRARMVLQSVTALFSLVLVAVVSWHSFHMWWEATQGNWTSGTAWNPSLTYPYAILPLGMLLIALQYLAFVARAMRSLLRGETGAADQ